MIPTTPVSMLPPTICPHRQYGKYQKTYFLHILYIQRLASPQAAPRPAPGGPGRGMGRQGSPIEGTRGGGGGQQNGNMNFWKWAFPGRQIVLTTPVSILPPTICPQRPYGAKIQIYMLLFANTPSALKVDPRKLTKNRQFH